MPALIVDQLRKSFRGAFALGPINLSVADGESVVLVGPSGAGKSTLLRLIGGLETPDSGAIRIGDRDVDQVPSHQRGIAFVTQRPALYPHLNVAENLAIGSKFDQSCRSRRNRLSASSIRSRVEEAAHLLRLSTHLNRHVYDLSGGEQRRVALGRAIVRGSPLWLLDEPFSQLDPVLRWEFCRELHLLRRHLGTTMIFVTHDPIEATALADRIGVLGEGRLLQVGTPEEVHTSPSNRTAALCLGWPPMNLIEGRSEPDEGSGFCFRAGAVRISLQGEWPLHRKITLGVRPENLRLTEVGSPGEGIPLGNWEVVAAQPGNLGWLLTLSNPSGLVASWRRVDQAVPTSGQVTLYADWRHVLWFDGDTGERIHRG